MSSSDQPTTNPDGGEPLCEKFVNGNGQVRYLAVCPQCQSHTIADDEAVAIGYIRDGHAGCFAMELTPAKLNVARDALARAAKSLNAI